MAFDGPFSIIPMKCKFFQQTKNITKNQQEKIKKNSIEIILWLRYVRSPKWPINF